MGVYLFDVYSFGCSSEVGFLLFNLFLPLLYNKYWFLCYLQLISCISMVICKIMLCIRVLCQLIGKVSRFLQTKTLQQSNGPLGILSGNTEFLLELYHFSTAMTISEKGHF
jgi:hypothetical protein